MTQKQERIVVGLDGSPTSIRALRWALGYAERTGAKIEAVYAWQAPTSYGAPVALLPGEDVAATAEQALHESVDRELQGRADLEVEHIASQGYPPKVLLDHAKSADLLVVGSRGHGGFIGTLLGSVSLHCVTHATCPVVVVHRED